MKQKTIGINHPLDDYITTRDAQKLALEKERTELEAKVAEKSVGATEAVFEKEAASEGEKPMVAATLEKSMETDKAKVSESRENQAAVIHEESIHLVAMSAMQKPVQERPVELPNEAAKEAMPATAADSAQMLENRAPESEKLQGKQRITLHISADVIHRVKNAVYWEPGLTLAGFAEVALEDALEVMENERGKAFPERRDHRLRGGRPIK